MRAPERRLLRCSSVKYSRAPLTLLVLLCLPACDGCDSSKTASGRAALKTAPTEKCELPSLPPPGSVVHHRSLTYATRPGGRKLALDLTLPRTGGPFALVVLIHGGGWRQGNRQQLAHEQLMLASEGFATASIDYRLVGPDHSANRFPAAIQDVRCAIRYLRARAASWRIHPERVALLGMSAGGHLAALTAAAGEDPRYDGACDHASQPVEVKGAVVLYAPLDLRPKTTADFTPLVRTIITGFLGGTPASSPARAALASPAAQIRPQMPPVLLLHGTRDSMVPLSQSRGFHQALQRAGVPSIYVEAQNADHGFSPFSGHPALQIPTCTALKFLYEVLGREWHFDPTPPMRP